MRDQKKAEEMAAQRVQLLSPLLTEGLDPAKARKIRAEICKQTGLSDWFVRPHFEEVSGKVLEGWV